MDQPGDDKSPRGRAGRTLRGLSFNRMLPNIITLTALCSGLTAIRFALGGDFRAAAIAVIVAGILDALDGRVARRLNTTSRFGAELDSLSDFCAFGVAPALVLYLWTMGSAGTFGWLATLLFPICSAMRLARFNVGLQVDEKPPMWAGAFFTGVPAPAGAVIVLAPLMLGLSPELGWTWTRDPLLVGVFLVSVGGLMVSRIPAYSFKKGRIPDHLVLPVFLGVALLVGLLATAPWVTLPALALLYVATLPLSWRARRRLEEADSARAAPAEVVELRSVSGDGGERR